MIARIAPTAWSGRRSLLRYDGPVAARPITTFDEHEPRILARVEGAATRARVDMFQDEADAIRVAAGGMKT